MVKRFSGMAPLVGLRLVFIGLVLISGTSISVVTAQLTPPSPLTSALPPRLQDALESAPPSVSRANIRDLIPKDMLDNFTLSVDQITAQVANNYSFCIQDIEADKRSTFEVNQNSTFLRECRAFLGDTFVDRVCQQSEIEFYFKNIAWMKNPPPTPNCNPFSWPIACEPGWGGLEGVNSSAFVDSVYSQGIDGIPLRTVDPQPCCAGFFCPRGLTCMMPCPLGAYCPLARYEESSGTCQPYGYQMRPESNLACGGADLWLTFQDSRGIFCEAGSHCPTTTEKELCEPGNYCRAGSTDENKCSFLSQCQGEGRKSQNLKGSGILLLVVLFILLLLIYNCSEHLLHIRQRRKSKAREVAAREAREHLTAVERWKRAKDAATKARKHAIKFSGELTRQLSRKKSKAVSDDPRPHGASGGHRSGPLPGPHLTPAYKPRAGAHSGPLPLGVSAPIQEEKEMIEQESHLLAFPNHNQAQHVTWSNDLITSDSPVSLDLYDPVHVNGADEEIASVVREFELRVDSGPSSLPHTRSQIYKYAYGQIEKEKQTQQMRGMGLKEVISSDGFRDMMEGAGRFRIELSFVDLSLILKGSGRRILSHVTGKFSPCRVSAVMGPSGAGKTTFLNALAGKETGSRITGQVFINGQPGSIQSYKRIIGFVPQDDIVHGTLTVEENLWFSAKYRLPVGMPKRERVLVVERIINTLGLHSIRDSLVGTVERRGISGGQRKRVNVAMELVIEPSLLILDEPTSGLDSTSSRLVLQALRREALLGVNVCVVLHQPSYGLFRMFDDVMLLAKGGFTVYLGPVDEIEEYFQSLNFEVPDRINPPDYFMDVLEGAAVPERDPTFDVTTLPVLWMCHKGYRIPPDLQDGDTLNGKKRRKQDDSSRLIKKSFTQDAWDDLRVYVVVTWDAIEGVFSRVKDLSGRRTPGFLSQYRLVLGRVAKQRFREARLFAQDYIILLLAGICMGVMADWTDSNLGAKGYTYTIIAVSLLVMIASLRTFSTDKLNFWRESASGINRLSFFLAKDTVDHFNTVIKPVVYLSMFYFFNDPRSTFASNYIITLALVYCVTGIAYVLAIVMNPAPAQLFSVFIPVVATLIVTGSRTGTMSYIADISFAEWALEAYVIANAERYTGVWLITRCGVMRDKGYDISNKYLCIGVLIAYGMAARIIALLCLLMCNRKRQK
ncbi:protein MpABCG24 [Marchantia polymorpha subsp. ruderalis]|uniref:ABC transporter domain-containing protein n=2 Tax=Marchantia polymorpha TaxID=3197 RepID=A0AAF6B252_MARPO|nr:hypothetical protein MARPO_0140s0016 [Marchantia polymorpha]BBN06086.1 hypothetical protein Mp_3g18250 [Marchantia polymorpha subsp. ruderalis]|eukprot:PTQ29481.1 hypothetical protein MARPO_0140s0016 [Marchantia polymorpha]